jgi:uncharacterized protein YfaS (alpha-2-macroglobulin family)
MLNHLVWRRILTAAAVTLVFFLSACQKSEAPQTSQNSPADSEEAVIVSSHTSGEISRKSEVYVRFTSPVIDEAKVGQSADAIFHITPEFPGSARFSSIREIVFTPSALFASGAKYEVSIDTDGLAGIPKGQKSFTFGFDIWKQAFETEIGEPHSSVSQTQTVSLGGTLTTADVEENAQVEKVLTASYLGQPVTIAWEHASDGRHHRFFLNDLARQANPASLEVTWDGKAIGVENRGGRKIMIPSLNSFGISKIQVIQGKRNYIQVTFSDPLDPEQDLNGLINLDKASYSTTVDGNIVKIFPQSVPEGEITVNVSKGIRNTHGKRLEQGQSRKVTFGRPKPQVRFVGSGVILPDDAHLSIPFEAVNVDSVQVAAFQIFPDNIGQFLQSNNLNGETSLGTVGRYLWGKTVQLGEVQPNEWQRFAIDIEELMRSHPGGIIRLSLSINLDNSIYECKEKDTPPANPAQPKSMDSNEQKESSGWDFAETYNTSTSQDWRHRHDPCRNGYYRYEEETRTARNFLVSNIGLIAKRDQHQKLSIVATDLRTATPLAGAKLEIRNFQNQIMERVTTGKDGFASVALKAAPFYLLAKKDGQTGYLKLNDGSALSTSHFDVGGEKVSHGIKGTIYGERGVWRPGDDIHLTFVLQDLDDAIPANHPVSMELYNPKGQLTQSLSNSKPVGDFYPFILKTAEDAPTGNWTAKAILGGATFTKTIKIETVVPNRLKVELDLGDKPLKARSPIKGRLFGQWLHGAKASGLKADAKARLRSVPTSFTRYADFTFDDPTREFHGSPQTLFEGKLDVDGYADFTSTLAPASPPPGKLAADFTMRVFEGSGAFSISQTSAPLNAYDRYIGIKLPQGDAARNMLLTDTKHTVQLAAVDADGNPVDAKHVQVTLYKIDWKWWWDKSGESLAKYASASQTSAIKNSLVEVKKGQGTWDFEVKYPAWGRYLIRACDQDSGHCSGKTLYIDWPGWAGRPQEGGSSASMLTLATDKSSYNVGETAIVELPEASQGRALLTVEGGSRIIDQRWLKIGQGRTKFELPVTAEMSPNVYVSVALLQPHRNKKNDRPIRLWGIVPIIVHNAKTVLEPVIEAADEWRPRQKVSFTVSEKQGRPMTYTVAVVDEGLLGLTGFQTPRLHDVFYRRESLGVKTWDLFDEVVGAYGGELERLLALGGSDEAGDLKGKKSRRRFPPVVKFLGAFHLKAGAKAKHEIELPQYMGAVRIMVVAGERGAYGQADKSVLVREPLGMLATLPRVLGPDEVFSVPISLFATAAKVKEASVKVMADDHFEVIGSDKAKVTFKGPGEQMAMLRLKTRSRPGQARLRFTAKGSSESTSSEVHIMIRNPNAPSSVQQFHTLKAHERWSAHVVPHGLAGSNTVAIEVSSVPPLNLDRRLNYLLTYPYGCVEQLTSSAFPQLYLGTLVQLGSKQKEDAEAHVNAAIDRLRQFQASDGSFQYWPGGRRQPWATSYAGHFLVEARRLGFEVPPTMMSAWLDSQHRTARSWLTGTSGSALNQAYRLYTLALANEPELGAMNRLREQDNLTSPSRWLLASAYRLAGQISAADALVRGEGMQVADHFNMDDPTFASRLRDQAILLNGLATLGRLDRAQDLVAAISTELTADRWYSTQSVAWALLAMARFAGDASDKAFAFEQIVGHQAPTHIESAAPVYQAVLKRFPDQGNDVILENSSDRTLYASITTRGIPKAGSEEASSRGIGLQVHFTDLDGSEVEIGHLAQGTDFVAEIEILNRTEREMANLALNFAVPSGWEIHHAQYTRQGDTPPSLEYQDVRDDRVLSYFGLKAGERVTLKFQLNAAYLGRFYMPGTLVEAMYDASTHALKPGEWVEVVNPGE